MAFRRRNLPRRKNWVSRQEHFWDIAATDAFPVAVATTLNTGLVLPADYATRTGMETVTVVRVRGWAGCIAQVAGAQGIVMAMVAVVPTGTVLDPSLSASYATHDVLWTGGAPIAKIANGDHSQAPLFTFDIKARRKLKEDQDLVFLARCNTAAVTWSLAIRSLCVSK